MTEKILAVLFVFIKSVIAVTGYGQESDRRLSGEAGIALHLVKPADVRALAEEAWRRGLANKKTPPWRWGSLIYG